MQGDLGFIFYPHKEIRPPPPPIFQKSDLSLPNTSPLSRNNLRLFENKAALLSLWNTPPLRQGWVLQIFIIEINEIDISTTAHSCSRDYLIRLVCF